ncbi:Somatostatin receptor type 2, partial [Biomphalaria glabrata]
MIYWIYYFLIATAIPVEARDVETVEVLEDGSANITCTAKITDTRCIVKLILYDRNTKKLLTYPRNDGFDDNQLDRDGIIDATGYKANQCNKAGVMKIVLLMHNLKRGDSGIYKCEVYFEEEDRLQIHINLTIKAREQQSLSFMLSALNKIKSISSYMCTDKYEAVIIFFCSESQSEITEPGKYILPNDCYEKDTIIKDHITNVKYCMVNATDLITMYVVYHSDTFSEAYMAFRLSEWRSRYLIILSSESGFFKIILAVLHSTASVVIQDRGRYKSALPIIDYHTYEYIAFCNKLCSCKLVVYSLVSENFTCTNISSTNLPSASKRCYPVASSASATVYLYDYGGCIINGSSPMQVVILIQACWSNTVAMCTVIPTHLFLVSYTWRLPNGYSNHTLVVILLKESSDMVRNFDLDGNFFDEGSHYIAVSTGVTIISYTLSKRKNYFLSSASNSPIGCYIYGEHQTTSYATPLHFKFNFPKYVSTSTTNTGHWCTPSSTIAGDNTDNDCDGYIDEEIDNQKDDDNDTKIDEDIAASTDTGCLPGWFGTKCDKLCHCNNSQCLMNGNCKENVTCLPGFFGLQCQYRSFEYNIPQFGKNLFDTNRSRIQSESGFFKIILAVLHSTASVVIQDRGRYSPLSITSERTVGGCNSTITKSNFEQQNTYSGLYLYSEKDFGVIVGQCYYDEQTSKYNI